MLDSWEFFMIGTLLMSVVFSQSYKLAVKSAVNDGAATVLLQAIGGLSVLLFAPFFGLEYPKDLKIWLILGLACVFYALHDRLLTTTRKHLQVSVAAILTQLSDVFVFIIGLIIFNEDPILFKFIGAGLIVCANILVFYKRSRQQWDKYVLIGIFAAFVFAIAVSIDINISENFNLPIYISITLLLPAAMIILMNKLKLSVIKNEYRLANKKYYLMAGFAWGTYILFLLRTFQLGEVTTIVPLKSAGVLLNVLVAYILLNERDNKVKKVIAAILVMIGVSLTVL